jgi:hypothetical protein
MFSFKGIQVGKVLIMLKLFTLVLLETNVLKKTFNKMLLTNEGTLKEEYSKKDVLVDVI